MAERTCSSLFISALESDCRKQLLMNPLQVALKALSIDQFSFNLFLFFYEYSLAVLCSTFWDMPHTGLWVSSTNQGNDSIVHFWEFSISYKVLLTFSSDNFLMIPINLHLRKFACWMAGVRWCTEDRQGGERYVCSQVFTDFSIHFIFKHFWDL